MIVIWLFLLLLGGGDVLLTCAHYFTILLCCLLGLDPSSIVHRHSSETIEECDRRSYPDTRRAALFLHRFTPFI
jgi:hypothetical protein